MIIHDTIGTHIRAASRIGFDWRGFVPVIDPDSLIITDIIDADAAEDGSRFRFVKVSADGTLEPGGCDAAIPVPPPPDGATARA